MAKLKYTVIKNPTQYEEYCGLLLSLFEQEGADVEEEVELLTLLIEKWESDNTVLSEADPVELLKSLMDEHNLKAVDLSQILDLSKGTVSKILNYQKGFSKETIRKLADYFKVSQEVFNRAYPLDHSINRQYPDARLMNTVKEVSEP